ncbi:hypothetical protein [Streptomyces parvulus]|uniref:hypothetical protein n=1 Tax=Streptomyces parvulus TaxID=146923 RepID=UPI0036F8C54E
MSPEHAPRRSQVVLVEPALSQLAKLTAAETHRLDRAIVAISVNPDLRTPVPDTLLRDCTDEVDGGPCHLMGAGHHMQRHSLQPGHPCASAAPSTTGTLGL